MRTASGCMSEAERKAVVDVIAANPLAGDLIPDGGGIRKLRVPLGYRGKRGGARVIYYHHSALLPVFLLTVFAKNERSDLSAAERHALAALAKLLPETYGVAGHGKARVR